MKDLQKVTQPDILGTVENTVAVATLMNSTKARVNELIDKVVDLGVPTEEGQLLASTIDGVRSWVTPTKSPVDSVAGKTGDVTLTKTDVGLSKVNNTTDANKPVSTAQANALSGKEDSLGDPSVDGQVLSSTAGGVRSWVTPSTGGGGAAGGLTYIDQVVLDADVTVTAENLADGKDVYIKSKGGLYITIPALAGLTEGQEITIVNTNVTDGGIEIDTNGSVKLGNNSYIEMYGLGTLVLKYLRSHDDGRGVTYFWAESYERPTNEESAGTPTKETVGVRRNGLDIGGNETEILSFTDDFAVGMVDATNGKRANISIDPARIATDAEVVAGLQTKAKLLSPAQVKLAVQTHGSGGGGSSSATGYKTVIMDGAGETLTLTAEMFEAGKVTQIIRRGPTEYGDIIVATEAAMPFLVEVDSFMFINDTSHASGQLFIYDENSELTLTGAQGITSKGAVLFTRTGVNSWHGTAMAEPAAAGGGTTADTTQIWQEGAYFEKLPVALNFSDDFQLTNTNSVVRVELVPEPVLIAADDFSIDLADENTYPVVASYTSSTSTYEGTLGAGFSSVTIGGYATVIPTNTYFEVTIPSSPSDMGLFLLSAGLPSGADTIEVLMGNTLQKEYVAVTSQMGVLTAIPVVADLTLGETIEALNVTVGIELAASGVYAHTSGGRTKISEAMTGKYSLTLLAADQMGATRDGSINDSATVPSSVDSGVISLSAVVEKEHPANVFEESISYPVIDDSAIYNKTTDIGMVTGEQMAEAKSFAVVGQDVAFDDEVVGISTIKGRISRSDDLSLFGLSATPVTEAGKKMVELSVNFPVAALSNTQLRDLANTSIYSWSPKDVAETAKAAAYSLDFPTSTEVGVIVRDKGEEKSGSFFLGDNGNLSGVTGHTKIQDSTRVSTGVYTVTTQSYDNIRSFMLFPQIYGGAAGDNVQIVRTNGSTWTITVFDAAGAPLNRSMLINWMYNY